MCRCQVTEWAEEVQGSKPRGGVYFFFAIFNWIKMRTLCVLGSVAAWEGGASAGRFKLLSVNVTPCYLDSNYTCQLSLSPHLSLSLCLSASLNPHTLCFSVFNKTMRSFCSFLYSSVTSLCQSVLPSPRFSTPLTLCIHCCFNPLHFIWTYTVRTQQFPFPTDFKHCEGKQQSDIDTGVALKQVVTVPLVICPNWLKNGQPNALVHGYLADGWNNGLESWYSIWTWLG